MAQNYTWPAVSVTATNPSVGSNGITAPSSSTEVGGINPGGNLNPLHTDGSNNLLVSVQAVPANQSVNLAQVGGSAISEGQKAMVASLPVAIASDQSTLPISAATLPLPSGASTAALQTQISGQLPATLGAKATAASLAVNIASDQTVPVSAASLPLPSGASTAALQTTGNTSLASIATNTGNIPAKGAATIANSTPVNIASDQTVPVSAASLPLPSGAATAALQTTGNTSLASIATNTANIPAKGQATMANSTPVAIASDQSTLPIKPQSGTFTDRSGTTSATPSTSTQVAASNANRKYFIIQNVHASNTIWINFTSSATASQPSIELPAGAAYVMESSFIATDAINVICTVASSPFAAKEG